MKATEFKILIKESVREVIQEELKDILLEAVRAPKIQITSTPQQLPESTTQGTTPITSTEKKAMMENIMGDMKRGQDTLSFNSTNAQGMGAEYNAQGALPGGDLPAGNLGLDQIMGLMKSK